MDFSYGTSFAQAPADAYECLLHDAMCGDRTLFIREDGVERAWETVDPVLASPPPLWSYPAGTWGPEEADRLIAPGTWQPS
jgi:glucose-6-phosphate 1-dehydrogenase